MHKVNERSAQSFSVSFFDADGVATTPATVRWRLKNLTTREVVSDWASVSPSSIVTITTTADMNTSRGHGKYDDMELVVQRDHADSSLQQSKSIRYRIVNIQAIDD